MNDSARENAQGLEFDGILEGILHSVTFRDIVDHSVQKVFTVSLQRSAEDFHVTD